MESKARIELREKDVRAMAIQHYYHAAGTDRDYILLSVFFLLLPFIYFNVTSFSARPEQHFLRALAWADNKVRQAVRFVVPRGLGKKDVYEGPAK